MWRELGSTVDRAAVFGPFPVDTASRRPSLVTSVAGPLMAERSLREGILGSRTNPVMAHGAEGQREYLRRLDCPNGITPQFARNGTMRAANGGADGPSLTVFTVRCLAAKAFLVYMADHDSRTMAAIPGFALLPEARPLVCPPRMTADADSNAIWIFHASEVAYPAAATVLSLPPMTRRGSQAVESTVDFIVDTFGVPEPASITVVGQAPGNLYEVAKKMLRETRFIPAEHSAECKVRVRAALTLQF